MITAEYATRIWLKLFEINDLIAPFANSLVRGQINCTFVLFPIIQYFFELPKQPPTIKTLTAVTGMMSGTVSKAVEQLIEQGLLARVQSEDGRRTCHFVPTEKLLAIRENAIRHFQKIADEFQATNRMPQGYYDQMNAIARRLLNSRIGGEHNVAKQSSDLTVPGFFYLDESCRTAVDELPGWMQFLHFNSNLRIPFLVHYYGKRGRMTLGKLRIMHSLFTISTANDPPPTVKELADSFRISPGAVSQTLDAMENDGMVKRVPSPLDRRVIQICLTPQGLRMRRQCSAACTKFMMNFLESEPPENVTFFEKVLDMSLDFLKAEGKVFLVPVERHSSADAD